MRPVLVIRWLFALFVSLTVPSLGENAQPTDYPGRFVASFDGYLEGAPLPPEVAAFARGFEHVMVAGILTEGWKPHFKTFLGALREAGVPSSQMHRIFPLTARSVDDDSRLLKDHVEKIAATSPRKLILVGHSKGGAGILAFALKNPEFVRDHVQAIYLVQPAIGGSPLTRELLGRSRLPAGMPLIDRLVFYVERLAVRNIGRRFMSRGIISLTPEHAARYWRRLLRLHPEAPAMIASKIHYIQATRPAGPRFHAHRPNELVLLQHGPNDGALPASSMVLDGLGDRIVTLEGTHTDFVHNIPLHTRRITKLGRALTYAMLESLSRDAQVTTDASCTRSLVSRLSRD